MKPVLVSYASAGNGHRTAARAIAEALDDAGRTPILTDALDFADPVFRRVYSDLYHVAGEHSHGVCGAMYRLTDTSRENSSIVKMIDKVSLHRTHPFTRFVTENKPDSVVATHFLPMSAVAKLKNKGIFSGSLFAVITDYDLHNMWFSADVDGYFVATREIERKLIDMGVSEDCIVLSGIPVRKDLLDVEPVRKEGCTSLSVLFLASSIADDKAVQIVHLLRALPERIDLSVICGRNESLFDTLCRKSDNGTRPLKVFGFVEDIQEHYARTDLLITKPGGLTIAEALCFGIPMLLVHPIPYQETRNAEFVQGNSAGWKISDLRSLGKMTRLLYRERTLLKKAREACLKLSRPEASGIIAHEVIRRSIPPGPTQKEIIPDALAVKSR